MLVGVCAHSAWRAAADSKMKDIETEVFAYFISVHITGTDFWKGCDRHCCRQQNGSICLFHKCAYTVFWKGCDMQNEVDICRYLIYK